MTTIGDFNYKRSMLKTVSAFLIFKKFYIIIRWRLLTTIHRLRNIFEFFFFYFFNYYFFSLFIQKDIVLFFIPFVIINEIISFYIDK